MLTGREHFFQKKTLYIVHNQVIPFFLIENDLLIYWNTQKYTVIDKGFISIKQYEKETELAESDFY
jgi:hypothetical protein